MVSNDPAGKRVKTTENAFAILRALKRLHGAGVSELADEVGLAKSTTHRHLGTLAQLGWVVEETDTYRIGFRFLEFGEHARQRKQGYRLAREKVEALADETAERVQFLVEENGQAVYVHRALGEHAVRTDPGIGSRIPLHATSGGKAILAQLPESRVDEIIERRGLAALTPHTITSREQLFEGFERIRDRGYSIDDQENIEGLRALEVPIRRKNGLVLGALSVSGLTHRMKGEWFNRELVDLPLGTANEIELNVQHS